MNLEEKHIIVIGGNSGMGLGIAKKALESGAEVTIVGRSETKLDKARTDLPKTGNLNTKVADITVESDVIKLFETIGSFHYLANTAADVRNAYCSVEDLDIEAARNVVDSKLIAAVLLAKHGASKIDRDGAFIFTSGINAYRPAIKGSILTAVNGSLPALARALSLELAPVRVNVISPGWVDTPIWSDVADSEKEKQTLLKEKAQELPTGEIGRPEDIAQAVLSTMQNKHITGTVLHVDGGQRLV